MEDLFSLPVCFAGKEIEFSAKMIQYGYTIKIQVEIEGTPVIFEPDEERNWRAVMGFEDLIAGKKVRRELLEAVAEVIGEITK